MTEVKGHKYLLDNNHFYKPYEIKKVADIKYKADYEFEVKEPKKLVSKKEVVSTYSLRGVVKKWFKEINIYNNIYGIYSRL